MRLLYTIMIVSLSLCSLTAQHANSSNALEFCSLEDIEKSSKLVHNTFRGIYEPTSKIIENPLNHEKIGQVSFDAKNVNVTYRATLSNPIEMLSNLNFSFASIKEYGFSDQSQGHAGFVESTNIVKDFVVKSIFEYQLQSNLKTEEMQITVHGQSRGTGLGTLTAAYLKDIYAKNKNIFVLNHAPLPLFNLQTQQECNQKLGKENILNFICEEDGVLQLVDQNFGNQFKRAGTDLLFSVVTYPDFTNRIGNYTHLSLSQGLGRILAVGAMAAFGISDKGWEGHMPESYMHSLDGLKTYRAK